MNAATEHDKITHARDSAFARELESLINEYNRESASDTPDFILANFMAGCLDAFDEAVNRRTEWYRHPNPKTSDSTSAHTT